MNTSFVEALHAAQEELGRLEERRAVLLRLIQNLKELSADDRYELTPPPGYIPKGLTEEVRTILTLTTVPLDAVEIRDLLIMRGIDYSNPKNLLINVHTVLGRIKTELEVIETEGEKTRYKAAPPEYPAINPETLKRRLVEAMISEHNPDLSSAEEQELQQILIRVLFQTTMPLSVSDLHTSCTNNGYRDRSPQKTRAFIESFVKRKEHALKIGKTLKGEIGFIGKKGAVL
jgi:hypothetical protein